MLIDDLKALAKLAEIQGCVVGVWAVGQDKEFQDVFNDLRKKPNLNLTQTLYLIKSHYPDIPFKRTAFVAHMRGTCTCPTA